MYICYRQNVSLAIMQIYWPLYTLLALATYKLHNSTLKLAKVIICET